MRKSIAIICVSLGMLCLLSAAGLVIYNRCESKSAAETTQTLLVDIKIAIEENKNKINDFSNSEEDKQNTTESETVTQEGIDDVPTEMPTLKIDEYDCIGILSIPALELDLPVLTDWSYDKLKKSPCLYYGSYYEKNFVIAAHNYKAHFGRLSQLQIGDIISFTDVNGGTRYYEVQLLETLPKEATREMITADFDLSLYTCTPGGSNRVTVRCTAIKGN